MNDFARRMMRDKKMRRDGHYGYEHERGHRGGGEGNKYFIYRDGRRGGMYDYGRHQERPNMEYGNEYDYRQSDMHYSQPYYSGGYGDYMYDGRYDYAGSDSEECRLTRREIKEWEKHLENADGSRGKKYTVEQIMPVAQQMGIRFDEFTEDDLCMTANMLYSDFCVVLGGDMALYVKLAKAFLDDDDFDGTGSEKLALYYNCIAEN